MAAGSPSRAATALPSLIAFGSQTTWPTSEYLFQLRAALLLEPRLRTFLIAIKELPRLWQDLIAYDPRLTAVPGEKCLDDLVEWVNHGELQSTSGLPPNVLTTPFTIIIHVIQYFHYIDGLQTNHAEVLKNVKTGGIQGFCTGILTAIAVACSKDEEDINVFGAVALKLALCIGAYVDLDGAFASEVNETTSIAVRWRSEAGHDSILETLKSFPEVSMTHKDLDARFKTYLVAGIHLRYFRFNGRHYYHPEILCGCSYPKSVLAGHDCEIYRFRRPISFLYTPRSNRKDLRILRL